ncbi:double-strand break repair helicase AddA [Sphingomonas montanisoli]|uniref:DNA 3'-5' helicase n=1 Tax=Sphingomonas montanisoli TaxID=2606412 RepID=A0A5D9C8Z1_9SPHN|nr:double-strand break repair helicase AddA [Sphingomonas montanisoli]TZG27863.1 double-strand break repair helicase AddA [Sphingomonas montanisoli]
MSRRLKPLMPLMAQQRDASDPGALVWLSASAGTGKTHVLTARVLRLLLNGVRPETILCLTFTKAGAAEMAERIHGRLAHWARLKPNLLAQDLFQLGEAHGDEAVARARKLFARVLEAPGGGLRIQTIHAFCQTLLAGFPAEAGLVPGFRPIEGREEAALARSTLATMLADATQGGDLPLIRDVQTLSRRLGEDKAESYLMDCARRPDAMRALGMREGIEARLRMALGVPIGDVESVIVDRCAELDMGCFHAIAQANGGWGTATGLKDADRVVAFINAGAAARAAMLDDIIGVALTKDGSPRKYSQKLIDAEPLYVTHCERLVEQVRALIELRMKAALAALLGAALRAGQSYALAYEGAKRAGGLVDFDDLIRATVRLLDTPGMGEWVRFKLDQQTDHILVDEAQDTNRSQWDIVEALAGEFFAGEGARDARVVRTMFTVGDFKQAIFGFQGTDPRAFERARIAFQLKAIRGEREFAELSLDRSFRSTPPVLELVDRMIADLGSDGLGLQQLAEPHMSARSHLPGVVTLWKPLSIEAVDDVEDAGEESWESDATREFATRLARQIKLWLAEPLYMPGLGRTLRPEDILVLVRRRGSLASLIVARLHAEGVPVAGVDRLRLNAPLAVRDLLAAVRFALQPGDDLSLASLLVSPLFGWSQERLYEVGFGRKGALWKAVRDSGDDAVAMLDDLLNQADFTTPYRFLEHMLTGPMQGRARLIARLGQEARDPIEELLNAALQFEGVATASLQRFLDWFDRGDVEITRDPSAPADAVRVMTAHGSKGLQAPLVILADATGDPDANRGATLGWTIDEDMHPVPVPRPKKDEMVDELRRDADDHAAREAAEHWRLLYVAATRAEEHLVIGGALGPRAKGVPPSRSWYGAIEAAMTGVGAEPVEDELWGTASHFRGSAPLAAGTRKEPKPRSELPVISEPAWLRIGAPREERPPRPLAPSSLGPDEVADPPPTPAMRAAGRRGSLLHALFERLPGVAPADRSGAAERWLEHSAGVADADERRALVADACAVIDHPAFAAVFASDALAEAPIAAVVDGDVIAGTVDRLLVSADRVLVVDFKTGRRVPGSVEAVPIHHLRQMGAYAAALATIFPGRRIEAGLLYTSGPALIVLPPDVLAAHKPGFRGAEQKQASGR